MPVALLVLQAVTGFVFLFLLQFAIFRARRYRLTRTRWRGIVAGQSGSAAKYALLAIVLIGLTGVTFGLAYPLMSTTLERYRMGNTWLGTERFAFSGQARELVARWLACWILLVPTLFLSFFWYRAAELRYFTRQTALGTLKFQSGITGGRLFAIYFVYFLAIIGMILLIITVVTATVVDFGNISADPENLAARLGAIGFLPFVLAIVFLLLSNVIYTWLILSRLLKAFCESLSVRGEMNFDALAQSTRSAPTRGEGLADALDIGGALIDGTVGGPLSRWQDGKATRRYDIARIHRVAHSVIGRRSYGPTRRVAAFRIAPHRRGLRGRPGSAETG